MCVYGEGGEQSFLFKCQVVIWSMREVKCTDYVLVWLVKKDGMVCLVIASAQAKGGWDRIRVMNNIRAWWGCSACPGNQWGREGYNRYGNCGVAERGCVVVAGEFIGLSRRVEYSC